MTACYRSILPRCGNSSWKPGGHSRDGCPALRRRSTLRLACKVRRAGEGVETARNWIGISRDESLSAAIQDLPVTEAQRIVAALAYAYGPGYRGLVCTLLLSQSGVKLGLNKGADLKDPQGLLRGSGKVHRHVQLQSPKDLKQTGLKALVDGARALCKERLKS